jgi:hypothetical protein
MGSKAPALSALAVLVPIVAAAAEKGDLEKYYPMLAHTVRWYAVKDINSGAPIQLISFAIIAKEVGPDGNIVYLVENRFLGGISIDYQQVTSRQVQLDRIVLMNGDPQTLTVKDAHFTPALPMLRAPVEVGRTWRETPKGDPPYTFRVESKFGLKVLGKNIEDCVRIVRTRGETVDRKEEYCSGIGIAAFEILTPDAKWLRSELVALAGETDLIAVKSREVPSGAITIPPATKLCEYIFDPLGPDNGDLTVTTTPPGGGCRR